MFIQNSKRLKQIVSQENFITRNEIRVQARNKFKTRLKEAIDSAVSKYDQILVTGNTRFGRLKQPACVACDRPLRNRYRIRRKKLI